MPAPRALAVRLLALAVAVPWMVYGLVAVPNYERVSGFLATAVLVGVIGALVWFRASSRARRNVWHAWFRPRSLGRTLLLTTGLMLVLGLLPSILRGGLPQPENHDEFSFLLGADTFLHGRLTNPTPPGWEHFESIHILLTPTYQSKFQPGMAAVLAVGRLLTGQPYAGTLLALVLAAAAVTWLLHLWLSPPWRAPMACLAVLVIVYVWGDHYLVSGPLACAAGAVQLALLRRFTSSTRCMIGWGEGVAWGLSLALLMFSRPFEGCVFSVLVGGALAWFALRRGAMSLLLVRVLPGVLLVMIPALLFQLHYNRTVTGSPWKLPYLLHEEQYGIAPLYLIQPLKPEPVFRHPVVRQFQREMGQFHQLQRDATQLPKVVSFRFGQVWINFGLVLWLIPLLTLPELWSRRDSRGLVLLWLALLIIMQSVTWFMPHYVAPAAAAWLVVLGQAIRYLRVWQPAGRPVGRVVCTFLVITYAAYVFQERTAAALASQRSWGQERARLQRELETQTTRYLILVRYGPEHKTGEEWVYNGGQLAGQRVIWARAMDEEKDRVLAWSFPQHLAYYLDVDGTGAKKLAHLIPVQQHPPTQ